MDTQRVYIMVRNEFLHRTHSNCRLQKIKTCVTSGFRLEVDEKCAVLGYYAAIIVISYRRFRTTNRPHLKGSRPFKMNVGKELPYILESNPRPFYSLRGLKYQMRIIIACGLDSRSWAGFWKNGRAAVLALRTIQYNNLLFYLLFIIYILYNIYNLLFIRLAVITHNWIVICHPVTISCGAFVPLAVKRSLHTWRVSWIMVKKMVTSDIIQSVCLVGKGRLKERCGLEPRTDFFHLGNRQKVVRIRSENIRH